MKFGKPRLGRGSIVVDRGEFSRYASNTAAVRTCATGGDYTASKFVCDCLEQGGGPGMERVQGVLLVPKLRARMVRQ